jgi:AraC-like DNA-binding protein
MHTGKKYNEYLTGLRVEEAMRLLRETDESIITIAMNVGFGTLRNFNYAFFSATGCTPSDFRKFLRAPGRVEKRGDPVTKHLPAARDYRNDRRRLSMMNSFSISVNNRRPNGKILTSPVFFQTYFPPYILYNKMP